MTASNGKTCGISPAGGYARYSLINNPEAAYQHLKEGEILIGRVRQELTDLIQELRPIEMKGKGLIPTVQEYICDWERRNDIDISIHVRGERALPELSGKSLFRILQEALANVCWHSKATKVDIVFNYGRNSFY